MVEKSWKRESGVFIDVALKHCLGLTCCCCCCCWLNDQVRHFKDYHGVTTKNVKEVSPKVKQQYKPYAPYQVNVGVGCVRDGGEQPSRRTAMNSMIFYL